MGTGTHLGIETFNLAAGINAIHVPARGSDAIADTIANTIAGRTDYALSPIPTTLPHIRAGRLLPLGVSSAQRSSALPDVPGTPASATAGRALLAKRGGEPMSVTQPDFTRFVLRESESAARIIEAAWIKPQ